jgi:hypothetical protein
MQKNATDELTCDAPINPADCTALRLSSKELRGGESALHPRLLRLNVIVASAFDDINGANLTDYKVMIHVALGPLDTDRSTTSSGCSGSTRPVRIVNASSSP